MKEGDTISEYFARVMVVVIMRNLGEEMSDAKRVEMIVRTLVEEFTFVVCGIEESNVIKDHAVKVEGRWNSSGGREAKGEEDTKWSAGYVFDEKKNGVGRMTNKISFFTWEGSEDGINGNDESLLEDFKSSMKEFEMTDLGLMSFFLGVEVRQSHDGIHLCQKKYAQEVLERFKMADCNPAKNPIVPGATLTKEGGEEEVDATLFKQMVGCLMYLTVTRHDMMYVVCLISRYMEKPREEHMMAAKRALRYLKGTLELGIFYKAGSELKVEAFTDSDYAGDVDDRRSTSGYVFLLNGAAVCWSSRKQDVVTLSSTEAEYVAATSCACRCVWFKGVLEQNFSEECKCMEIYCDNTSSIKLSKNSVMHRRTKHIDVKYHYLRDLTNQEVVKLVLVGTGEQVADVMTKPVKLETFVKLRSLMGMQAQGD